MVKTVKKAANGSGVATVIEVHHLAISLLDPHPHNPRPWSDIYECPVYDDKVEEIAALIKAGGYDQKEAIQVVPIANNRYQILAGHHRYCAVRALEMDTIPCFVLPEMTEMDAALMLVSRQGRGVDGWELAKHAWLLCEHKGMSRPEYAKKTGNDVALVHKWIRAQSVRQVVGLNDLPLSTISVVAGAPEEQWRSLVELAIEQRWSTRQMESYLRESKKAKPPVPVEDPEPISQGRRFPHLPESVEAPEAEPSASSPKTNFPVSRVSLVALSLLRYLQVKSCPTSFKDIYQETSFCWAVEEWDLSDQSLRQALRTMANNSLVYTLRRDGENYFEISPKGHGLLTSQANTDAAIANKAWKL
jgi:ParB-like nuclease domain